MELHSVLEAGLQAGDLVANAAHVVGGIVHQAGDTMGDAMQAGITSDCCVSNNPPPSPDPTPNL
jgi:hypothetical protein